MALQSDSDGFLIGGSVEEWRKANRTWRATLREVQAIRSLLDGSSTPTRRGRGGRGSLSTNPEPATAGARRSRQSMPPADLDRIVRASRAATGSPAARRLPPRAGSTTAMPPADRDRDERGRFLPGTRPAPGAVGGGAAPPSAAQGAQEEADRKKTGKSIADALKAAFDGRGGDGNIDPVLAAANEVREVVEPFGRAFGKLFGSDKDKKKEQKTAGRFKRLIDSVKALPEKIAERLGGIGGSSDGGSGLGGLLRHGATAGLGMLGGLARRIPFLAPLVAAGAGLMRDRSLAASGAGSEARVANLGATAGDVGGAVLGGIVGGALLGPFGAAVGAAIGPFIIRGLKELLSPFLGEMLGWVSDGAEAVKSGFYRMYGEAKDSSVGRAVAGAVSTGTGYLAKLGMIESSNDPANDSQRRQFLRTGKGSTASGLYQFIDSTFADQVARNGAKIPAAAGLVDTAKAYLADKRSTLEKARDTKAYGALFDAKLNPGIAGPVAQAFTDENRAKLARVGITNPTDAQLYSVHLTGGTVAAEAATKTPAASAASIFGEKAVAANQALLGGNQSVGEVFGKIDSRLGKAGAAMGMGENATRPLPSYQAPRLPPIPEPPPARSPINSTINTSKTMVLGPQQGEGQDIRDRRLAHIATGGLSR